MVEEESRKTRGWVMGGTEGEGEGGRGKEREREGGGRERAMESGRVRAGECELGKRERAGERERRRQRPRTHRPLRQSRISSNHGNTLIQITRDPDHETSASREIRITRDLS